LGALETADLRDGRVELAEGARARRRTWAWLAVAGALGLFALFAGTNAVFRDPAPPSGPPATFRPGLATFRIEAEPAGARVWIDETDVGPAPVALPVTGGRHTVRVAVDGYAPAELSLDIAAGTAPPPLRFVLEPVTARLSVTSEPPGATVRVDGKTVGVSPIQAVSVAPGRHEVRVEKRGYRTYAHDIRPGVGERVDLNARLVRRSGVDAPLPSPSPVWIPFEGALVEVDPTVTPPVQISGASPPYPDEARRMNFLGAVKVEMIVDENGVPNDIRVVQSAGEILDRAVVNTVRTWRYKPAEKSGVRVKVRWAHTQTYVK
jgi:TonB family protein